MNLFGYPTINSQTYNIPSADSYYTIPTPSHNSSAGSMSKDELIDIINKSIAEYISGGGGGGINIAGSISFANLPEPSEDKIGNIYNITDAFTTTDKFVEGAGKKFPGGTNVVIVSAEKYDAMMGAVSPISDEGIQDIIDSL